MHARAGLLFVGATAAAAACGGPSPRAAGDFKVCPAFVDMPDLLRRHVAANGGSAFVASRLPVSVVSDRVMEGRPTRYEFVADATRYRLTIDVGTIRAARGIDDKGPWELGLDGVPTRFEGVEAIDVVLEDWMTRRKYVDETAWEAVCVAGRNRGGRPTVRARANHPELGMPVLLFDLATADLLGVEHARPDGRSSTDDATEPSLTDSHATDIWHRSTITPGLTCHGDAATLTGPDCLAIPPPRVGIRWPASGIVRVPLRVFPSKLLVRANVDGHDVWAAIDSGALVAAFDPASPVASGFHEVLVGDARGLTSTLRSGVGELSTLRIGDLALSRVPAASVPIKIDMDPSPALFVGHTLFKSAAVRIDFAAQELALAREAAPLVGPGAEPRPIRLLNDKIVAHADIEDHRALVELDTAGGGVVSLYRQWASAKGVLDAFRLRRKVRGIFGVGNEATEADAIVLRAVTLGPIELDNALTLVTESPDPEEPLAGILGDEVLSRCKAVIFDLSRRVLWLEPPCD